MSSDSQFSVGQRWLSNTETELGLGVIMGTDFRSVEVLSPQLAKHVNIPNKTLH
ncbi:ATP-dependent helicase HepA [Alteromonas mediterranea 615]|uniref:ATP-dependent helicase HepA n=1 Tax=Alteromonas mediterranea 615 TaxID=1300253 RepID=S5AK34_9ALTE|nr:ATP-dependent helicase HepA [Alteromonas mediterranea 615]